MAKPICGLDWIENGEQFALVGLSVEDEMDAERIDFPDGLLVLAKRAFDLPDHWQEWLGTMQVEDLEGCNLFLVAKKRSTMPNLLDDEVKELQALVGHWFMGLLLQRSFSPFSEPVLATGRCENGAIEIRSFDRLDPPARTIVGNDRPITTEQLSQAALVGSRLAKFHSSQQNDDWRLLRCLEIYRNARNDNNVMDRIHQFTRCIEGLILPKQGETKRQFKSRTELFIGSSHHVLTGELYDVRSNIEHLHEYKHLEARDRLTRIRLAELEAISEYIARSCLARIILDPVLAVHFSGIDVLADFWTLPTRSRQALWGNPVNPMTPLFEFDFDCVSDEELGVRGG